MTLHSSSDYNYTIYIFFCTVILLLSIDAVFDIALYGVIDIRYERTRKEKVLLDRYLKLAGITTSFKAS
jgi:hypothetical protein